MPSGFGIPVPNPLNLFGGGLFGGDPLSSFFGAFGKMIFSWIVATAAAVFDAVVKAINNTGPISFAPSSWWGTKVGLANAGTSLWATVIGVSLAVMLGCVILAAIQGAIQGEPMVAVKAVGLAVPTSMFGIVAVVAFTAVLVGVVDDASSAVLAGLDPNFKTWFAHTGGGGFMPGFVMFVALLGGLLVWMELILRAGFVYLFVLLAPLALAVRVWPAMGGFFRRFAEIGIALIVSKFVIAVALALGSAAMAGGSQDPASAQGISAMATGAGLMLVSAFAPFVILRMVHGIEGAVAHQGMSHAPGRAAMTAVNLAASGLLIGRLAGGSGGGVRGGGGGGVTLAEPAAGTGPPGNAVALSGRWGPTGGIGPAPAAPPQPLPPGPTLSLPPGPRPSPPPGPPASPPPPPAPPAGGQPTSLGSSAVFIDVESRPGAASDKPIGNGSKQ